MAQPSGIQQLGNYKLIKKLGEGGMGAVYLADDINLNRRVAVKVLPKKYSSDANLASRFRREAKAAGQLNHQNIVGAFAVGEDQGFLFYVMEFCAGEPLDARQKRERALPVADVMDILKQVASGLQYAHQHGFIHRDIKPANIIMTLEGVAKILDLGLSKKLDDSSVSYSTLSGQALGTPHYISPEQARGEREIDGRADIYSLGATAYHLLAGKPPFEGATSAIVMAQHLTEPFPDPTVLRPDLPPGIAHIVLKCTCKLPADRYRDCAELLEDVDRVNAGQAPLSQLPAAARRGGKAAAKLPARRGGSSERVQGESAKKSLLLPAVGVIAVVAVVALALMSQKPPENSIAAAPTVPAAAPIQTIPPPVQLNPAQPVAEKLPPPVPIKSSQNPEPPVAPPPLRPVPNVSPTEKIPSGDANAPAPARPSVPPARTPETPNTNPQPVARTPEIQPSAVPAPKRVSELEEKLFYEETFAELLKPLAEHDFKSAAQWLEAAREKPEAAGLKDVLALDLEMTAWPEAMTRAMKDAAVTLKDGQSFTINRAKPNEVIKVAKDSADRVINVTPDFIEIERKIGAGAVAKAKVKYDQLAPETRDELIKRGLPPGVESDIKLLYYPTLDILSSKPSRPEPEVRKALNAAARDAAHGRKAQHLLERLDADDREKDAAKAFPPLESALKAFKIQESVKLFAEFKKNFTGTLFLKRRESELEEQVSELTSPGLWAMFYSGDSKTPGYTCVIQKLDSIKFNDPPELARICAKPFRMRMCGVLHFKVSTGIRIFANTADSVRFYLGNDLHMDSRTANYVIDPDGKTRLGNARDVEESRRKGIAVGGKGTTPPAGDYPCVFEFICDHPNPVLEFSWHNTNIVPVKPIPLDLFRHEVGKRKDYEKEDFKSQN